MANHATGATTREVSRDYRASSVRDIYLASLGGWAITFASRSSFCGSAA
ncbi:MAG: hypothetical protein ACR2K5_08505 [Pseudolabrys sp.]